MKITLPIQWNNDWKDMDAEIVDVAPHLASVATFAILANQDRTRAGKYGVCNVETGLHVFSGGTIQKTIEGARSLLACHTADSLRIRYRKAVQRFPQLAAEA